MRLETRMVVVMLGVVLGSAALLGVIYGITSPLIVRQKQENQRQALAALLPQAETFEPDTVIFDADTSIIFHAYKGEEKVGIVFTVSPKGYAGPIETMVGLRRDTTVSGIRIASPSEGMSETPGLGAQVLKPEFRNQFKGLSPDQVYLQKEGGKVEAITAATISSNAVTSGVRKGIERYACFLSRTSAELPGDTVSAGETEPSEEEGGLTKKVITAQGYAGEFTVIVYLDPVGNIARLEVPEKGFEETFGIGSKCREEEFLSRFVGLSAPEEARKVEAISGATVTSRAIKKAVASALK